MNEIEFKKALAPFSTESFESLSMTDSLEAIGVDSISVFELLVQLEDVIGPEATRVDTTFVTVQDLYDHVQTAAGVDAPA